MKLSERDKPYLKAISIVLFGALAIWWFSKDKFTCDTWVKDIKNKKEFHLVLTKKERNSRDIRLEGINTKSRLHDYYEDGSGWLLRIIDTMRIGDTVIKNIGEYSMLIKRKGAIIKVPCPCGNKIYKDTLRRK